MGFEANFLLINIMTPFIIIILKVFSSVADLALLGGGILILLSIFNDDISIRLDIQNKINLIKNQNKNKMYKYALSRVFLPTLIVCILTLLVTLDVNSLYNLFLSKENYWGRIILIITEVAFFIFLIINYPYVETKRRKKERYNELLEKEQKAKDEVGNLAKTTIFELEIKKYSSKFYSSDCHSLFDELQKRILFELNYLREKSGINDKQTFCVNVGANASNNIEVIVYEKVEEVSNGDEHAR